MGSAVRIVMASRPARPVAAAFATVLVVTCGGGTVALPDLQPAATGDTTGLVARGEYVVRTVAVCGHCHAADPQEDPDGPLSGGMAFSGWRLGTMRASNITPDSATGIGDWSEAHIVRAIRTGEDAEDEVLAPVMPYAWFHGMSDRDALAVARYLMSRPPVHNEVDNDPNIVYHLASFFFLGPEDSPGSVDAPPAGPSAEYGRYLAHHVGLCADCHTPRGGVRAQPDLDRLFAGQSDPPSGFPARPSNLTPDSATGIGLWSEADFVRTLRTGVDPEGDSLHPFMPWRQVGRMREDDLRAIYRYLRTLPPIEHRIPGEPIEPQGAAQSPPPGAAAARQAPATPPAGHPGDRTPRPSSRR
jgi:mono/diheme cytochrome c family protein